jgi:hypothetical protein
MSFTAGRGVGTAPSIRDPARMGNARKPRTLHRGMVTAIAPINPTTQLNVTNPEI